jgi:amino acid transporter
MGPLLDDFVGRQFHLTLGWITWAIVIAAIPLVLTIFGIKPSSDISVILGVIEIMILVVLSVWLIATGEHANLQAAFSPKGSLESGLSGWQGILHGMIFAFLAFGGFESCAPLAEEARNPRRTVPLAIVLSTLCIGLFSSFARTPGSPVGGPIRWPDLLQMQTHG